MTNQQVYKLEKVISLVEDTLRPQNETNDRVLAIWLKVAGDYCNEVAEDILKIKNK